MSEEQKLCPTCHRAMSSTVAGDVGYCSYCFLWQPTNGRAEATPPSDSPKPRRGRSVAARAGRKSAANDGRGLAGRKVRAQQPR
jgi:hypothetical protein